MSLAPSFTLNTYTPACVARYVTPYVASDMYVTVPVMLVAPDTSVAVYVDVDVV